MSIFTATHWLGLKAIGDVVDASTMADGTHRKIEEEQWWLDLREDLEQARAQRPHEPASSWWGKFKRAAQVDRADAPSAHESD